MTSKITLHDLNKLDTSNFVDMLAEVFEHSPWVPEDAAENRPFNTTEELYRSMVDTVKQASAEKKLTLLRAHPQLAGKEAQMGELTDSSTNEQLSAGLKALNKDEMSLVCNLNADYLAKFGFPFIIAVKNHTKESIFSNWEQRLQNSKEVEFETCLEQVYEIARIRLEALLGS